MAEKHLLIVGAGSVGKRHLRNLKALGCRLSAFDPLSLRLDEAQSETSLEGRFTSFEQALANTRYDGVVICSPPKFHVEQCLKLVEAKTPILLEKPVSPDLASTQKLQASVVANEGRLLLGYTYRWWKPLRDFKTKVDEKKIGKPLAVRCVMSAHLADWHPWERYQDFFMASKDLGGGALLDESHFLDLMLWFFGMPSEVFAKVEKLSSLEIDTDDNVDAILTYEDGLRVVIHLDLFGRPHEKYITVTGEVGTLQWSFDPNRIRYSSTASQEWNDTPFQGERNDMFVDVAREFLAMIETSAEPSCSIQDGLSIMKVIDAMRRSSESRSTIKV